MLLLALPHQAECTRKFFLAPREGRGHVVLLCFVIASSSKHGDIMRRTFVVEEGMILFATGMDWRKTRGTPPTALHCTPNLTRFMHLLARPSPGRAAYRTLSVPVCAEQVCDNGSLRA